MTSIDWIVLVLFIALVIVVGMWKGKTEDNSESYFLAGRGLKWWLVGISLISANISTEQFVGMSGQAAGHVGLAIASYEWIAAATLLIVAFVFLPRFLKSGIYTIPEFLEYRYNAAARSIMALFTMIIYVGVTLAAVIFSGAITLETIYPEISIGTASWVIGIIAALYVVAGGLKACAWADLVQGSALILCGGIITWLAFAALGEAPLASLMHTVGDVGNLTESSGAIERFFTINADKLHLALPSNDTILPWTALLIGLWIPNLYYWGFNQYIIQRTLGSHSLAEGQKGIVFAAGLKLVIPFIIVFPGLIAFNLFSEPMMSAAEKDPVIQAKWAQWVAQKDQPIGTDGVYPVYKIPAALATNAPEKHAMLLDYNERSLAAANAAGAQTLSNDLPFYKYDSAFGLLINKMVPSGVGLRGFIIAALLGAIISSLASMLNAASTIFSMDLYKKYLHKSAKDATLVRVGRIAVGAFVVIACLIAPLLGDPKFGGIFTFIQEFQGYISPGILAVFVFGFCVKKAPPVCGIVGLLLNPLIYYILKVAIPSLSFLDRMAISFFCLLAVLYVITLISPQKKTVEMPKNTTMDFSPSRTAQIGGAAVFVCVCALYVVFW